MIIKKYFFILFISFFITTDILSQELKARGMITSIHQPVISSQISAKIKSIPFRVGDSFKKDDILILFDDELLLAQLEKTRAELKSAELVLENKKTLDELDSIGTIEVDLARSELKKREAEKKISDIALQRTLIKAPFSGRIAKIYVNEHEVVGDRQKLIEIVSMEELEIKIMAPSKWLSWLNPSLRFDVILDDTKLKRDGQIKAVGAIVDPVSKMILIRGEIENSKKELLPGMSADVVFKLDNK